LVLGYAVLLVATIWILATWRSKHRAYLDGLRHGMEKGERIGYEKYGEEVAAAMGDGVRAASHAARTRHALTPQADWGPQGLPVQRAERTD